MVEQDREYKNYFFAFW